MTISDATISVDVFEVVRTALTANPITVTEADKTRKASILAQYNDKKPVFPQIVITPINISEDGYKFGSKYGKKFINVIIECYYPNTYGVDVLSDAIREAVTTAVDNSSLVGMDLSGITETYSLFETNENKIHFKAITFTFIRE